MAPQDAVILARRITVSALQPKSDFEPSPQWSVTYNDGTLILSGGADQLFALEGVDAATAAEIVGLWSSGPPPTTPRALEIAGQLTDLGICRRTLTVTAPPRFALIGGGELSAAIETVLIKGLGARISDDHADLLIFVRTGGRLVETYPDGMLPATPHVLIDAAYHHTFSIGPLVVPGDTACLACLAGRIGYLWGDPPAPERPAIQRHLTLLAEIAALEIERIAGGDLGLAGQTVAYDFERRCVITGSVYKLPWCPVCGDGNEPDGSIVLLGDRNP
jgi:bacteriocin biosynthesis cyclodehydratase domain-containing protein